MSTTISSGNTVLTPRLVLGYASTRTAQNVIHWPLGRPDPDVTLKAATPRAGSLELLVDSLADGLAMEAIHAAAATVTLADTDRPELGMRYVAAGSIRVELDPETRTRCLVTVDYQEIAP